MNRCRLLLTVTVLVAMAVPASAGIFFNRKPAAKPASPQERVPTLVTQLRSDPGENKREAAAEELRSFDPMQFPEIVPALCDALLQDQSANVRLEAARSLSRLRPINGSAGAALEQAMDGDESLRIRMQIRPMLWQYQLAGYKKTEVDSTPRRVTTQEPPLAPPLDATATPVPGKLAPVQRLQPLTPVPPVRQSAPQRPATTREPPMAPATGDGPDLTVPK
jgi:hypothetical protein